jgi:hypothetical protein
MPRARLHAVGLSLALACQLAGPAFAANNVVVDDTRVFPESITALADGAVIFGSAGKPVIYRAPPGATHAKPWISLEGTGVAYTLGVLADPKTDTLWACGIQSPDGSAPPKVHATLKTFSLKTGAPKASYLLPGEVSFCNDIAIGPDGAAYVSDTLTGRIFRVKQGGLEMWLADPLLKGIDGLSFLGPVLYLNIITTGHVLRLSIGADGSAGAFTDIALSQPLNKPDGMRALGGRLFVAENAGGRVDELKIEGDTATVVTIRDGFSTPTAVEPIGNILWVGESKLKYRNDPALKDQDPGSFTAYALALPK